MKAKLQNLNRSLFLFTHTFKYLKLAQAPNADYLNLKGLWAKEILKHFNVRLKVINSSFLAKNGPSLLVGNHISYMDILGLIATASELSFVSKKEVQYIPIIGTAATRDNTIFVKRESKTSRGQSRKTIAESLLKNNSKVVIFPSGTTTITGHRDWRHGAFQIAHQYHIPIQPFRLIYKPLRVVAYIENDSFPTHIWKLAKEEHIDLTIEFHEPVHVEDPVSAAKHWQSWSEAVLKQK